MNLIQLDFFEEKSEMDLLRDEVKALKASNDKVRKAMFARHGELANKFLELNARFEAIERGLCLGHK
jgi:hypothetical protein